MVGKRPRAATGFAVLALTGAWLATAPSPSAASSPAVAGSAVVEHVARSPEAVRKYWTRARMRAAAPVSIQEPSAAGASVAADERATAHRRTLATRLAHIKRRPTRTSGKVFFSAGIFDYQCSGTAVRSPSRSLVFTAGHCGYLLLSPGLGNAVHNWEFVPAYDDGRAPFGRWPAESLAAPRGWAGSTPPPVIGPTGEPLGGDSRFDTAAATVARRRGKPLQKVVGGRRIAFNERRAQQYEAIGYPAGAPFDGQREYSCSSGFQGSDASFEPPRPISISCDMTAGSSGGGWLDSRGRLVSVTSYGYAEQPNVLYGPYFGTAMAAFYRSVRGG